MSDKIQGYRELNESETDLINRVKDTEIDVADIWRIVKEHESDPRWLAIAKTHFQEGFMAMVKAIAKSEDPFN